MKKYIFLSLALILCFTSCKNDPDFGDAVFVTGTLSSSNIRFLVDGQSDMAITVSSSEKAIENVSVEIAPDPSKLDAYNTANNKSSQLPPDGSYTVNTKDVTIEAGKVVSTPLEITANSSKLQDGVSYCLPVTITNVAGGGLKVLESSRTAYVVFTKVISTKVAMLSGNESFEIPTFKGESSPVWALNQMTLEIKTMPTSFGSEMHINPLMGSHESLLFRFGDGSSVPSNKLQLAKYSIGTNYHPDNKPHYETVIDRPFEPNTWYHIATTYDGSTIKVYVNGELVHQADTQGGQINLAMAYGGHAWDDTFAIGRGYGENWHYNGCVSECRIWNIARTQAELQDGTCYVDPASKGLIAYWRFNGELQDDGTVLDETGHGHNAHPKGHVTWVANQKCPF